MSEMHNWLPYEPEYRTEVEKQIDRKVNVWCAFASFVFMASVALIIWSVGE